MSSSTKKKLDPKLKASVLPQPKHRRVPRGVSVLAGGTTGDSLSTAHDSPNAARSRPAAAKRGTGARKSILLPSTNVLEASVSEDGAGNSKAATPPSKGRSSSRNPSLSEASSSSSSSSSPSSSKAVKKKSSSKQLATEAKKRDQTVKSRASVKTKSLLPASSPPKSVVASKTQPSSRAMVNTKKKARTLPKDKSSDQTSEDTGEEEFDGDDDDSMGERNGSVVLAPAARKSRRANNKGEGASTSNSSSSSDSSGNRRSSASSSSSLSLRSIQGSDDEDNSTESEDNFDSYSFSKSKAGRSDMRMLTVDFKDYSSREDQTVDFKENGPQQEHPGRASTAESRKRHEMRQVKAVFDEVSGSDNGSDEEESVVDSDDSSEEFTLSSESEESSEESEDDFDEDEMAIHLASKQTPKNQRTTTKPSSTGAARIPAASSRNVQSRRSAPRVPKPTEAPKTARTKSKGGTSQGAESTDTAHGTRVTSAATSKVPPASSRRLQLLQPKKISVRSNRGPSSAPRSSLLLKRRVPPSEKSDDSSTTSIEANNPVRLSRLSTELFEDGTEDQASHPFDDADVSGIGNELAPSLRSGVTMVVATACSDTDSCFDNLEVQAEVVDDEVDIVADAIVGMKISATASGTDGPLDEASVGRNDEMSGLRPALGGTEGDEIPSEMHVDQNSAGDEATGEEETSKSTIIVAPLDLSLLVGEGPDLGNTHTDARQKSCVMNEIRGDEKLDNEQQANNVAEQVDGTVGGKWTTVETESSTSHTPEAPCSLSIGVREENAVFPVSALSSSNGQGQASKSGTSTEVPNDTAVGCLNQVDLHSDACTAGAHEVVGSPFPVSEVGAMMTEDRVSSAEEPSPSTNQLPGLQNHATSSTSLERCALVQKNKEESQLSPQPELKSMRLSPPMSSLQSEPQPTVHRRSRKAGAIRSGRWCIGQKIGSGAFGVVYVGLNNVTGTLMAVKQITLNTAVWKDIRREVDLLKSLRHPNIVQYYGTEMDNTHLHIFQEWVAGGSITRMLSKFGAFSASVIRSYTSQSLEGLAFLHDNGVMHRDIKGSNILVSHDGVCKLCDFGGSKRIESDGLQEHTMRGTPYFCAPEVFEEMYSSKADIWSIGCVVFQMATGVPPWKDRGITNPVALYNYVKSQKGPPDMVFPAVRDPDESVAALKSLVTRCFRQIPDERPSARELSKDPFLQEDMYFSDDETSSHSRSIFSPGWENLRSPSNLAVGAAPLHPSAHRRRSSIGTPARVLSPPLPKRHSPQLDTRDWPTWARQYSATTSTGTRSSKTDNPFDSLQYSASVESQSPLRGIHFLDSATK